MKRPLGNEEAERIRADDLGALIADYREEIDFSWEADDLVARRRFGETRATGPVIARAPTASAMRKLLTEAQPPPAACACSSGNAPLAHIARVLRPRLHAAGLDIREVVHRGETIEIIVIAPADPSRGRIVLDRNGLVEWDHWCGTTGDVNGARLADAIIDILGAKPAPSSDKEKRQS